MVKCGVPMLPLGVVPVTRITSTVSAPSSVELQAEQGKLFSKTAYITFIQVFKNSIKKYCRSIPKILKTYITEFFCFMNLLFQLQLFHQEIPNTAQKQHKFGLREI